MKCGLLPFLRGVVEAIAALDQFFQPLGEARCRPPVDDIVSEAGYADTIDQLDRTVGLDNVHVWHCNDAKAERGSKLDRHQPIGKGSIGLPTFKHMLNDPRLAHAAFIAETPIDEPLDDLENVNALKKLVRKNL